MSNQKKINMLLEDGNIDGAISLAKEIGYEEPTTPPEAHNRWLVSTGDLYLSDDELSDDPSYADVKNVYANGRVVLKGREGLDTVISQDKATLYGEKCRVNTIKAVSIEINTTAWVHTAHAEKSFLICAERYDGREIHAESISITCAETSIEAIGSRQTCIKCNYFYQRDGDIDVKGVIEAKTVRIHGHLRSLVNGYIADTTIRAGDVFLNTAVFDGGIRCRKLIGGYIRCGDVKAESIAVSSLGRLQKGSPWGYIPIG